ncbi:hypothetical protein [Clostridioides difficile]|nr:hypothetical protein [Clostridioides difficile]EQG60966.1 hypothetical protein QK3_0606 [Clostridioides difficile DA00145]EQI13006.1 hypothetical protein QO5_0657 [Clostridioides difficile F253]EQJ83646.1 hypothetical protein QU5_0588 [Clostridioides difficile P45]EQK09741.1 hypothetical protein QUI_0669 [Clostridioides difficile P59]
MNISKYFLLASRSWNPKSVTLNLAMRPGKLLYRIYSKQDMSHILE